MMMGPKLPIKKKTGHIQPLTSNLSCPLFSHEVGSSSKDDVGPIEQLLQRAPNHHYIPVVSTFLVVDSKTNLNPIARTTLLSPIWT
jgi:hypothetical protein